MCVRCVCFDNVLKQNDVLFRLLCVAHVKTYNNSHTHTSATAIFPASHPDALIVQTRRMVQCGVGPGIFKYRLVLYTIVCNTSVYTAHPPTILFNIVLLMGPL